MRNLYVRITLLIVCLVLAAQTAAWAHVTIKPEEAPAGDYATLTVQVPNEKEIPTTEVRLEVPEGFTVSGVQPVPGWDHEFEEEDGVVEAIAWSGGELGPREFQQFLVSAKVPDEAGEFAWKATQTYEDGTAVEWIGPPDSEEPAPTVDVTTDGSGVHGAEETGERPEVTTAQARSVLPDSGGDDPTLLYGGLSLGALVTGAALLVLRRRA